MTAYLREYFQPVFLLYITVNRAPFYRATHMHSEVYAVVCTCLSVVGSRSSSETIRFPMMSLYCQYKCCCIKFVLEYNSVVYMHIN